VYANILSFEKGQLTSVLLILVLWSIFWKGWALWKAARGGQKYWYIALLLVNSLGILEIIFLIFFQKKPKAK